jgi:hypothetical protein
MGSLNQDLAKSSAKQINTKGSTSENMVTEAEVKMALENWGQGLVSIANAFANKNDYKKIATEVIKNNYAYETEPVLFKPTLASNIMFRTTFEGALSYFIGGNEKFSEDNGFALNPWKAVNFDLAGIKTGKDHAIVMGNKLLTDKNGKLTIANFTMGFTKANDGTLKINLHHSSLPYKP